MPISIDALLLGIIALAPCSGYDMKTNFEKSEAGMLSALSFGSIYPRLKQLEADGLIEIQQRNEEGRRKRIYELTAQGWRELATWLEQPADYPLPIHDELLLKILFWGAADAERDVLIHHLQQRKQEAQNIVAYMKAREHDGISFIDEYTSFVYTYMYSKLEAELTWIDATIKRLEAPAEVPPQDPGWLAVLQKSRRKKAFE